jgi:hypothetical protein
MEVKKMVIDAQNDKDIIKKVAFVVGLVGNKKAKAVADCIMAKLDEGKVSEFKPDYVYVNPEIQTMMVVKFNEDKTATCRMLIADRFCEFTLVDCEKPKVLDERTEKSGGLSHKAITPYRVIDVDEETAAMIGRLPDADITKLKPGDLEPEGEPVDRFKNDYIN